MTSPRVVSRGVIMKLWPFLLGALIVCFVVAVSQIYGSVFIDGVTVVHDYWSLIGGATALGFGIGILITYLLHPLTPILQQAEYVIEESFEMMGAILILVGTQQYLEKQKESPS